MTQPNAPHRTVPALWLWPAALALAAAQTWIDFDAVPGINWLLSTLATVGLCVAFALAAARPPPRHTYLPLALALLLAGGVAVTANFFLDTLALGGIAVLLALGVLAARGGMPARPQGLVSLALSPLAAVRVLAGETGRRLGEAAGYVRAESSLPVLRGVALATPVTVAFALLLSNADPTLESWRHALLLALRDFTFLGRAVFFGGLALLSAGSLGVALAGPAAEQTPALESPRAARVLGSTERLIVLGAVVALFSVFLLLQLSHLLGREAGQAGSGVTYAQAAHQGFAELNVTATLCVTLLLALARSASRSFTTPERVLATALVVQTQLLLLSAFHRIDVYETVYGYTALRLFVQCYSLSALVALGLLAIEIQGPADFARLMRRWATTGALALAVLLYWNHAAWIVEQNLQRYERTGRIDLGYLARGLGPDAVPTLAASLPRLPAPLASQLRGCLRETYATGRYPGLQGTAWFEWSARRGALRQALAQIGSPAAEHAAPSGDSCREVDPAAM